MSLHRDFNRGKQGAMLSHFAMLRLVLRKRTCDFCRRQLFANDR